MTPLVAMETGRARCGLDEAPPPARSLTPDESVLMTLEGRDADAREPSRLIPAGGSRQERTLKKRRKRKLPYVVVGMLCHVI